MKNLIILLFALTISFSAFAQSEKYTKAMSNQLENLKTARSIEDLQASANGFARIAKVESSEWLPNYYQAYSYMKMATVAMEKDPSKIDAILDQAQASLDAAKELTGGESEVFALQGYIYQGRIWPNPQQRGAEYTQKCYEALGAAMQMNPANPRPYFIKGQNTFYMPEFWGGGVKNAMPLLSEAKEKFTTFKPESSLHPNWGAERNAYLLEQGKSSLATKQ